MEEIRKAKPDEFEEIYEIGRECFDVNAFGLSTIRQFFALFPDFCLVACSGDKFLGYTLGGIKAGSSDCWILDLDFGFVDLFFDFENFLGSF